MARSKRTWRWDGTAPEDLRGRGAVYGERARAEVGCRLGEGQPNARPPGVRWRVGSQNAVDSGR
jgi:hypothetical protein